MYQLSYIKATSKIAAINQVILVKLYFCTGSGYCDVKSVQIATNAQHDASIYR